MLDKTPKPVRNAKTLRMAYLRRAYTLCNSPVCGRSLSKIKITPSMVGKTLGSVINLLNRRERYRKVLPQAFMDKYRKFSQNKRK